MSCIYIPKNIKNFAALAGLARGSFAISLVVCIILSACGVFAAGTIKTGSSMDPEMDIAKAVIVVGKEAEAPEIFAAEELSKYVEKMSGVKLRIAKDNEAVTNENFIFIGTLKSNDKIQEIVKKGEIKTDKLDKDRDGFIIKTMGNKMVLIGSNPRSSLYSVYAFLERLGCLWPAQGEDYVPALTNICVQDVDVMENADLNYRMSYGFGIENVEWVDWLAKNRCNWIQFYSGSIPSWEEWKKQNIGMELDKRGIKVAYGLDYTMARFLPPAKYYKEHPEYYALMNGKRIKNMVCVSNPDVIRLEAENIIDFLRKNPEVGMITLSACDGYDWCDCEQCMKLDSPVIKCVRNSKYRSTSNSHIIFQNEVLKWVNKVFPDIKFNPTAYAAYAEPPRVKPQDMSKNLLFMFTFNGRCSSHAICDKDCARNQSFYSGIEGWAKWYGDKKMVIPFDLNCGMWGQYDLPLAMLTTTPKDFPYYKDFGGIGIWHHVYYVSKLPYVLNSYLAMRLAWNVNESLDKILSAYFEKRYGKAGGFMRDYYMVWEDIAQQSGRHCSAGDGMRLLTYVTENDVKKCEDNLAMAEKASESKEITARIMDMKNYFNYVKLAWLSENNKARVLKHKNEWSAEQTKKERMEWVKMAEKIAGMGINDGLQNNILKEITATLPLSFGGTLEMERQPNGHTVFLAHFNTTLDADYARGGKEHKGDAILTQNQGGKFGEGLIVSKDDRSNGVCYPLDVNIKEGTIEFWVKPNWDGNFEKAIADYDLLTFTVHDQSGKTTFWIKISTGRSSFVQGGFLCFDIRLADGGNVKNHTGRVNIKHWKKNEWHHVAVTWKDRELYIYLDGEETAFFRIGEIPQIGVLRGMLNIKYSDSVLDEIRILDVQ